MATHFTIILELADADVNIEAFCLAHGDRDVLVSSDNELARTALT